MLLALYEEGDIWLTEKLETDARVMKELGGALPKAEIPRVHDKRLAAVASGAWFYKIVPAEAIGPVGTIGIWPSQFKGAPIAEMGWMLLPDYQGKGYAGKAARLLIGRVRHDRSFPSIHAFPGASNAPSNAICRKLGFSRLEDCDVGYAGRPLKAVHWELKLS